MNTHKRAWATALAAAVLAGAGGIAVAAPQPQAPAPDSICRQVPEAESHLSVLVSAADVLWVEGLKEGEHLPDARIPDGDGARIVISSRPFTTAAWLQSLIDCHVARNAALGKAAPASRSPIDVLGAAARVSWTPGMLIIDVTSHDKTAAREILARARALVPARV